jgi:retron-type reverse transcriptase
MKTYDNLWPRLCSWQNLQLAYENASKHKTNNPAVRTFAEHHDYELSLLRHELRTKTYRPRPLKTFILRDPKTRVICKSSVRDRVVHHALVNILHPIFEPRFIHDSYASRKGKGTLAAINRFDDFARKVTRNGMLTRGARTNNDVVGYALKCDVKHYFDTVDHTVLQAIIGKRIHDPDVRWLVQTIIDHHHTRSGKGMPLGNWTSQFFANIYLNELDQFIKHERKANYYLRYVDDFVILDRSRAVLEKHRSAIATFLSTIKLDLHPTKCSIIPLRRGVPFLGFRIFYHYKLPRQRNLRSIRRRLTGYLDLYQEHAIDYDVLLDTLQGWEAYAKHGNTFHLRERLREHVLQELDRRTTARRASSR